MKTVLVSRSNSYLVLIIVILCGIFAIREFTLAKRLYDYLLVLLLLLLGYFFLNKALMTSSLSYADDIIFMRKIGKNLSIPFNRVLEIKRERATVDRRGPLSFGYRIFYLDEYQRRSYSIVFVRSDKTAQLASLAEKIKTINPSVIINL